MESLGGRGSICSPPQRRHGSCGDWGICGALSPTSGVSNFPLPSSQRASHPPHYPPTTMPIPYGRQTVEEDDVSAVVEVLRGDWLTQGPAVRAFEEAFASACDAPHAVAFSSGTAALHAALHVAGIGAGDEMLTSAITFAASANCGAYVGAKPTFADIDPTTWNVSAETIRAARTGATRAVVIVHFAGLPAPVAEVRAAVGDSVTIVEDAAHALGARTREGPVGTCRHSDMAVFSLHPVKAITSGEGGVVTTRRGELAERLRE